MLREDIKNAAQVLYDNSSSGLTATQIQDAIDEISNTSPFDWQTAVIDKDLTAPPGSPTTGDRYIVAAGATGAWSGEDDNITQYNGTSWDFDTANEGMAVWVEDENEFYIYDGSAWDLFAATVDHDKLQNINWASAGHTMDAALDMNSQNITNGATITGSTLTDGTINITGGALSGLTSFNSSATDIVGSELETLSDTSNADSLHVHTLASGITDNTSITLDYAFDNGKIIDGATSDANAVVIGSSTAYTKIGAWDIVGAETTNFITSESISIFGLGDDSASTEPMAIFAGANTAALRSPQLRLTAWDAGGLGSNHQDFTFQAVSGGAATITTSTGDLKLDVFVDIDADSNNIKNVATITATSITDGTATLTGGAISGINSFNGSATDITGTELETLSDTSNADALHIHTGASISGIDISDDTNLVGGDGLTLTDDTLSVNVDSSTIEINTDSLRVKADGINDTHIDWGTGTNQVSAVDSPIADTSNYFTGTETETALQEVGDKFDAMNEPTGFPNRTDSVVTWSDSGPDYTLSIAPVGGSFSFYYDGLKYTKSSTETHQISGAEGLHYIYYDAGSLTSTANPTFAQEFVIITSKVLVAIVYWDATNSEGIYVGEERHGITMDGDTHANIHFSVGLRWYTGIALNTIDADQSGADNAHAQFGVDVGSVADEDIGLTNDAVTSTTGLPVYWRSGASGDWRKDTNNGYSFLISGTRPNWNELTGGSWQQTETGDKDFMLVHVFATTEKDNPIIAIMGQAVYEKKKEAREGATTEVGNLLLGNVPGPEITPIASVIFECKDDYTNDVNARIVTTDEGGDYVDWRTSDITRTTAGGDHGSLGGLNDDDHSQYWVDTTIDTRTTDYTTTGTVTIGTLTDGTASISSGVGSGFLNFTVDNLNLNGNQITSDTGTIDFNDDNLTTTGTITSGSSIVIDGTTNPGTITETNGTISFDNENLTTTGIATVGTLTDGTATITGGVGTGFTSLTADNINCNYFTQVDGDFEFYPTNAFPKGIKVYGSNSANFLILRAYPAQNACSFISDLGTGTFRFWDNSSTANYVSIIAGGASVNPELKFTGDGKITSSSGTISFDDENLTTTGTITATTLTDGTFSVTGGAITGATNTNWDLAYAHIAESGASHTYLDQSVVSASTPVFGIDNFTDGGGLVLITSTQETNFETAYTHSQDNSQAHSDYLINNGDDTTSGTLTADGLTDGYALLTGGEITTLTSISGVEQGFYEDWETGSISGTDWPTSTNCTIDGSAYEGNYCVKCNTAGGGFTLNSITSTPDVYTIEFMFYASAGKNWHWGWNNTDGTTICGGYLEWTRALHFQGFTTAGSYWSTSTWHKIKITIDYSAGTGTMYYNDTLVTTQALSDLNKKVNYMTFTSGEPAHYIKYDNLSLYGENKILTIPSDVVLPTQNLELTTGTLTASTLTDSTLSISSGAVTALASITDGTASWTGSALSGFSSITGTTLTDGTAILTSGDLSGLTSLDVAGDITLSDADRGNIFGGAADFKVTIGGGSTAATSGYIDLYGTSWDGSASKTGNVDLIGNVAGGDGKIRFYSYDGASTWTQVGYFGFAALTMVGGKAIYVYDSGNTDYLKISTTASYSLIESNSGYITCQSATGVVRVEAAGEATLRIGDVTAGEYTSLQQEASDGDFVINRLGTGGDDFGIEASGDMYLGMYGDVGINTKSPASTLDVNGDFTISTHKILPTNFEIVYNATTDSLDFNYTG